MKTIICGPPHSGKSVLIANLVRYLPSDSYLRINANGDGEGSWSNNPDQQEIARVRIKSSNSSKKFAIWTENIKNAFQDVVIIDIGGKLQEDKIPLFEAADSFVVLSSDPNMVEPWKNFGESHGCRCLAVIESDLTGSYDEVAYNGDYMYARISGLERGRFFSDSKVIKALADILVCTSGYRRPNFLDFSKVGESIGCALEWTTSEGVCVTHSHFNPEHGPMIYDYLTGLHLINQHCKIYGLKANWVAAIASAILSKDNLVSFFDDRSGVFRPVTILRKTPVSQTANRWVVEEGKDFVKLSQHGNHIPSGAVTFSLPEINEDKPLYLSGRFPTWVAASILNSYSSKTKFLFQPGNHYFCVESETPSELGSIKCL